MSQEEKEKVATIKLKLTPGGAKLQEVAGTLGQKGIPGKIFVDRFNNETGNLNTVPNVKYSVKVISYKDKSFQIICSKKPTVSTLVKKAIGLDKLKSKSDGRLTISMAQVGKIAKEKIPDLYIRNEEQAIKTISGSLRSMKINIE